ncbi:MAG TPA: hypothetical protein VEC93_23380 [Anaerolineae bacterium]|nr:hypothetical protein [Anaerolineae bacterium]
MQPDYTYGQATFQPAGMTADQLTEGCFRVRRQFNEYNSIFKRALDFKTNCRDPYRLGLHLASNFVSRREILKKQGRRLGEEMALEPALV